MGRGAVKPSLLARWHAHLRTAACGDGHARGSTRGSHLHARRNALASLLGDGSEVRLYEDVGDYDTIKPIFEEILAQYNAKRKPMNLVFFEDALEHLTRISRTIRLPQGNCLLVGVGGSGKQSLSRLAAYTAGCEVFEITLTRGYDEVSFREDLKKLYGASRAGV